MKRKLVASILGIAATLVAASALAQGRISLDNYNTSGPNIVYGSGSAQIPGSTAGAGIHNTLPSSWTVGIFWQAGDVRGGVGSDATGYDVTSTWANGLILGVGLGSQGTVNDTPIYWGQFTPSDANDFVMPGVASGSATVEVFAYAGGSSYNNAAFRGHSTAFLITPAQGSNFATLLGTAMPSFSVYAVPEPSTFALAGLGAAAMLIFRRRK